jgi:hypothetical protein
VKENMRILVTYWIPLSPVPPAEQAENVADFDKKYPIPSFMKLTRLGSSLTKEGMKSIEIYEVEKGKLEEAIKIQFEREAAAAEQYSGYKSNMEVIATAEDMVAL